MENKNEMMVFDMDFGSVRVVNIDGEGWLVGKDVAEILGYKNTRDALHKHVDEEDKGYIAIHDGIQNRNMVVINESGLYKLITYSKNVSVMKKEKIIEWFKEIGFINDSVVFNSRKEINFLDKLEKALIPFGITGIKQYNVLDYKIDYYIPSLNVAIEYDENGHKYYTYEAHELRQELIEKELGCRFIRVTDNEDDYVNIGLIIKELFNIK